MADPKQARALLAEIPAKDSFKGLAEITDWLESLNGTEGFKLDRRWNLLDQLDQAAKPHERKLTQEYMAPGVQKIRQGRIWATVFEFWRNLGAGYVKCVEAYQAGAAGSFAMRGNLPVLIARALRTSAQQLKWLLLGYGTIDARLWDEFGRLYLLAESKGLADKSVQLLPGNQAPTSVRQEFLKAMMLSISSPSGLQPLQIEIAERVVAHFADLFVMDASPLETGSSCFDLSMRKAPAHMRQNEPASSTLRYFTPGQAREGLARLIEYVTAQGVSPAEVNLGATYDPALLIGVLKHLALYWAPTPPARSSERKPAAEKLAVIHGFAEVLRNFDRVDGNSLDFSNDEPESWIVENVSEGGYGAIVPSAKGEWVKVGSLVALEPETSTHWKTGVVRRIARDGTQSWRVGIEVLAKQSIPVRLAPAGQASTYNTTREGEGAVLLSMRPDHRGEIGLLLRVASFTPGQPLEMQVRGKSYLLNPARLVEGGEEYDLARFKVSARSSASSTSSRTQPR
jgi:hypothetical protein